MVERADHGEGVGAVGLHEEQHRGRRGGTGWDDLAVGVESQGAAAGRNGDEAQARHAEAAKKAADAGEEVAAQGEGQAVFGFVVAFEQGVGFFFEREGQIDGDGGRSAFDHVVHVSGGGIELERQRINRFGHAQQAHKVAALAGTGGHSTGGGGVHLLQQV